MSSHLNGLLPRTRRGTINSMADPIQDEDQDLLEFMKAATRSLELLAAATPEVVPSERILAAIETGYDYADFAIRDVTLITGIDERRIRRLLDDERTSFRAEVRTRRIRKAKRLLRTTAYRVSDIAFLCGYTSASAFAAQFKAATGVPPAEHRRARGGPRRAGGPTGAFYRPAARARAKRTGAPHPGWRRPNISKGERAVFQHELGMVRRRAELEGRTGRSISIVEMHELLDEARQSGRLPRRSAH